MDQARAEVFSVVDNRTEERRRRRQGGGAAGSEGDAALEVMLAQHEEREEQRMLETLSAQDRPHLRLAKLIALSSNHHVATYSTNI